MNIDNSGLDGVTLVAMKNGQPVENQAETVTQLLRPLISTVLQHSGSAVESTTNSPAGTTVARDNRLARLEIECATLRHCLSLADRRYEEVVAVRKGVLAVAHPFPLKRDLGVDLIDVERGESGEVYSLTVADREIIGAPRWVFYLPSQLPTSWINASTAQSFGKIAEQLRQVATEVRARMPTLAPVLEGIASRAELFIKLDAIAPESDRHFISPSEVREWRRPRLTEPDDVELRRAVREIVRMLSDREWTERVSGEPDAVELESAITALRVELFEALDALEAIEQQKKPSEPDNQNI